MVLQTIGRTLDLFDLDANNFPRWGENVRAQKQKKMIEEDPKKIFVTHSAKKLSISFPKAISILK